MKNQLDEFIFENQFAEIAVMNDLQNAGIVSDNAVRAGDVAQCDSKKAVRFLMTGEK